MLYGLFDVLMSVGAVYPDMTTGEPGDALLDVSIVAASHEPFRCFGNIPVEPHFAIDEVDAVDAVVVCDLYTSIHEAPRGRYGAVIEWLRRLHKQGALISSVCTGSLLLAESGLLDGRSCAGHWAYADLFRTSYPQIGFDSSLVLDLASEADGVVTAGGVTAWQDLTLHLITRLCGAEHAIRTAKVYLLGGHEDGQLPFAAIGHSRRNADAAIGRSLSWIDDNIAAANPVTAMADSSGLTRRTFARRFRTATGKRPIEYVHSLRIERAREFIESGVGPIEDIGYRVGYEDLTFFRRLFRRSTGLTPAAYRRRYATITPLRVGAPPMAASA
ncbi:MAG: helix-turn-helix domain-containing protein [Chloroflexi bacterium]|nr:helix-turn-helix domain-containing protein [Chloroflexota bacterium]